MRNRLFKWLLIKYPQNYIIRNPFKGALIISLFCFGFTILYKPMGYHASRSLSFGFTMACYSLISGSSVILSCRLLKSFHYFSDSNDWTILKELLSGLFILFGVGVFIYFVGFFIEPSAMRWNIPTFLDSCKYGYLLGIIPFTFFTGINYLYLFSPSVNYYEVKKATTGMGELLPEELIHISSQLKNEELNFYPGEFIYAESDGNYVVFYLNKNNQVKKEIIRNSINNIEQQLSGIPYFLRTHRAFIVNLKKVMSKQGNTLGYLIKLTGPEFKIPVSRKNTRIFNELFSKYHL